MNRIDRVEKVVTTLEQEFKEIFYSNDYRVSSIPVQTYLHLRKSLLNQIDTLDDMEAKRQIVEKQREGKLPGGTHWDNKSPPILKQVYAEIRAKLNESTN